MSKNIGRNDPCYCGSGKKYKHCHLLLDQEQELRQARQAEQARAERELQRSPEDREADERWDRFLNSDAEEKINIFLQTLAEGQLDADEAFEMLMDIREELDTSQDPQARARYAQLVERLKQEAPDLYHRDIVYYTQDLIDDAIADERWDEISNLVAEFAEASEPDMNAFFHVIDRLMYHGQTKALLNAMSRAWPNISESDDFLPHGISRFTERLLALKFFDYLEASSNPGADDQVLRHSTEPYGEYHQEWIEMAISHLTAPSPSPWHPDDFGDEVDAEQWAQNLNALLLEFIADQRRRTGMPLSKGELMREQLEEFLSRQLFDPRARAASQQAPHRHSKSKSKRAKGAVSLVDLSLLVPCRSLLNQFLGEVFDGFLSETYKVGCVVELLPAYLHFLARLGLIKSDEMKTAITNLKPLANKILTVLKRHSSDSHLLQAVTNAWSEPSLQALCQDSALAAVQVITPETTQSPKPKAPDRRPGSLRTYSFKVTYLGDDEEDGFWCTIEITEDQTLKELQRAIRQATQFDDDHLYFFFLSGRAWDEHTEYASPQAHEGGRSAAQAKIGKLLLRMKQKILYIFDYGDEHHFSVQLVAINPDASKEDRYPKLVEIHGEPPEQYPSWDWAEDEEEEEWDEEE